MRSPMFIAAATILMAACGGEKAVPSAETKADASSAPAAPPAQPTIGDASKLADTLKPARSDSAARKAAGPARDSAFGPKFTVDSTGKVTPIKKTP